MGLDTDFDCWHGPYSSFHNWRANLCRIAGMGELEQYVGFGGEKEWPTKAAEPLVILLHHSDCDGQISAKRCAVLAARLAKLLKDTVPEGGFVEWTPQAETVHTTERFIKGLRRAVKAGKPVTFH